MTWSTRFVAATSRAKVFGMESSARLLDELVSKFQQHKQSVQQLLLKQEYQRTQAALRQKMLQNLDDGMKQQETKARLETCLCRTLCLSLTLPLSTCVTISLSLCLSLSLPVSPCLFLFDSSSLYLCHHLSFSLSLPLSTCVTMSLSL